MPSAASSEPSAPAPTRAGWGLLERRWRWSLSRRGRRLLGTSLAVAGLAAVVALRHAQDFLAVNAPLPARVLVLEGWAKDYVVQAAQTEFTRRPYERLYLTGGPIAKGAPLCAYRTTADFTAAELRRLGMASNAVEAVPAPETARDRTYLSASALKRRWQAQGRLPAACNVVTEGPHARRTWLLFARALGPEVRVGVICVPSRDYDAAHWWRSSNGVRTVLAELIAYGYARFIFRPPPEE